MVNVQKYTEETKVGQFSVYQGKCPYFISNNITDAVSE